MWPLASCERSIPLGLASPAEFEANALVKTHAKSRLTVYESINRVVQFCNLDAIFLELSLLLIVNYCTNFFVWPDRLCEEDIQALRS